MVIRTVHQMNKNGSLGIVLPIKYVREMGLEVGSQLNMSLIGKSIHVNPVKIIE